MKATIARLSLFFLLIIAAVSCQKAPENPGQTIVHLTTCEAREITAVSAVVDAESGDDYAERGVCWSTIPDPTVADFHVANGHGKGEYSCTLADLEFGKKYYYRAYAYNGKEYVYATDKMDFTTKDGIVDLATGYVTNITLLTFANHFGKVS